MAAPKGNPGCGCADETQSILGAIHARSLTGDEPSNHLSHRSCQLPDKFGNGEGVLLTQNICVPVTYGSSKCIQHDYLMDPRCQVNATLQIVPAYCFRPWCFVDARSCARSSKEAIYRSSYFDYTSGIDLFYSYSTCNSTASDWFDVKDDILGLTPLQRMELDVIVPSYLPPSHFKRDQNTAKALRRTGKEYYDDNVEFEGIYVDYASEIKQISQGDIKDLHFTYRSKGSSESYPDSSFTAAVLDVANGLADMAIGPFWITGERLALTSFTIPVVVDKSYLVVKRPDSAAESLNAQMRKVLDPFSLGMWAMILLVITITATLGVWFNTERRNSNPDRRQSFWQTKNPQRRRKSAYVRLALDSFLQKGNFFCGASVEHDPNANLASKILAFGFGFFILITVSAYVANLAAFLTRSEFQSVTTVNEAIRKGYTLCAHPVVENELRSQLPNAKFFFHENGKEFIGMLKDYDDKKCEALVIGWEDTSTDIDFLSMLCERSLVFTDSVLAEISMGFPIRPSLSAGFSYWMYYGQKFEDINIPNLKEKYSPAEALDSQCVIQLSELSLQSADEYAMITVQNMYFPLVFFAVCALIGIILQCIYAFSSNRRSLIGRVSQLDLTTTGTTARKDRFLMRRRSRMKSRDGTQDDGRFRDSRIEATEE